MALIDFIMMAIQMRSRLASMKTENGFYYSYYEQMVRAESISEGLNLALWDERSEAPNTINAVERFNIYQELVVGALYRVWQPVLEGVLGTDPFRFYINVVFLVNGLGQVALCLLPRALGDSGAFSVLAAFSLAFLNRDEICRLDKLERGVKLS